MRRILDVSLVYRTGFVGGHFASFHDSLAEAAAGLGHEYSIAAPSIQVAASDPRVSLRLDSNEWRDAARAVACHLAAADPHVVLVYEGSLSSLVEWIQVARDAPEHTFLINLFEAQHPLNLAGRSLQKFVPPPLEGDLSALAHQVPPNLRILADTERRAFVAEALGMAVAGRWPLHSSIAERASDDVAPDPGLVLIGASFWQFKHYPGTLSEVDSILNATRTSLAGVRFELLGSLPARSRRFRDPYRRVKRLPGAADGALSEGAYVRRIRRAGVVWLPTQGLYTGQSSGKAVDVLAAGRPLLAPSGTYGADEQRRWIPGAPSYGSLDELLEILRTLPRIVEHWSAQMEQQREAVRGHYSAPAALRRLLSYAEDDPEARGPRPRPAVRDRWRHSPMKDGSDE